MEGVSEVHSGVRVTRVKTGEAHLQNESTAHVASTVLTQHLRSTHWQWWCYRWWQCLQWRLSLYHSPTAVVYFFQAGLLFSRDDTNFWPFLACWAILTLNCALFGLYFEGLNNAVAYIKINRCEVWLTPILMKTLIVPTKHHQPLSMSTHVTDA